MNDRRARSAAQVQRESQYVYAESRPFHERFWWLPVATVAAGCLALTGVLVWLSYFGPWSHV